MKNPNNQIEVRLNRTEASWYKVTIIAGVIELEDGTKLGLFSPTTRFRPLPPPVTLCFSELNFGSCVDFYDVNCWREGVIFDCNVGHGERSVFFPDCGIEIKANYQNLRLTQLWDEITQTWKIKGKWHFLNLIEECNKDSVFGAEIACIARFVWLTMFDRFLEGHSMINLKPLCQELVSKFLQNKNKPAEKNAGCGEEIKSKKRKQRGGEESEAKKSKGWVAVDPMEYGGGEYCPEIIPEYARIFASNKKPGGQLTLKLKKHLLYYGYKIERGLYKDSDCIFRFRYTKPAGNYSLSLYEICREWETKWKPPNSLETNISHNHQQQNQLSKVPSPKKSLEADVVYKKPNQLPKIPSPKNSLETDIVEKKRPKRSGTILSILLDNNVVKEGMKVEYVGGKNPELKGWITRDGIKCSCCNEICSLSKFEEHAGSTKHRPSEFIMLENSKSLLELKKDLQGHEDKKRISIKPSKRKKNQPVHMDGSDTICSVCLDGGNMVLCDKCPSAFHKNCIGLEEVPPGAWFCPFCPCHICGTREDKKDGSFIWSCFQCLRMFHPTCVTYRESEPMDLQREKTCYCSKKCEDISVALQKLIGKPFPVGKDDDGDDLQWILLKGSESSSCNDKRLRLALEVMHESFEPVEESHSGRDLIEDVIYGRGSTLNRLNCRGFYTAVLMKKSVAVSAANVRVLGDKMAEVPLVATKFSYRRNGMCRTLMDELEKQLLQLGVKEMILPSTAQALDTWVKGFGFVVMSEDDKKEYLGYTLLDFQGTVMCHKSLR